MSVRHDHPGQAPQQGNGGGRGTCVEGCPLLTCRRPIMRSREVWYTRSRGTAVVLRRWRMIVVGSIPMCGVFFSPGGKLRKADIAQSDEFRRVVVLVHKRVCHQSPKQVPAGGRGGITLVTMSGELNVTHRHAKKRGKKKKELKLDEYTDGWAKATWRAVTTKPGIYTAARFMSIIF